MSRFYVKGEVKKRDLNNKDLVFFVLGWVELIIMLISAKAEARLSLAKTQGCCMV